MEADSDEDTRLSEKRLPYRCWRSQRRPGRSRATQRRRRIRRRRRRRRSRRATRTRRRRTSLASWRSSSGPSRRRGPACLLQSEELRVQAIVLITQMWHRTQAGAGLSLPAAKRAAGAISPSVDRTKLTLRASCSSSSSLPSRRQARAGFVLEPAACMGNVELHRMHRLLLSLGSWRRFAAACLMRTAGSCKSGLRNQHQPAIASEISKIHACK